MTNNKLLANRRNALQSTGPTTPAGREKSAQNARRHGLYTAAVVPAAGESAEEFASLCARVHEELAPEGAVAERLVDRVALILWRFDRVVRYEAAAAARSVGTLLAAPLPPDPDTLTGDEVEMFQRVPEGASPEYRLAHARGWLREWGRQRDALRAAAAALGGQGGTEPVDQFAVRRALEAALGWDPNDARWAAALAARKGKPLVGGEFKGFVEGVARTAGLNPEQVIAGACERLAAKESEFNTALTEKGREEAGLVTHLRAARAAALAAGLYADGDAVERVMRAEAHLTRQLGLTLDLLERLRGGTDPIEPAARLRRLIGSG